MPIQLINVLRIAMGFSLAALCCFQSAFCLSTLCILRSCTQKCNPKTRTILCSQTQHKRTPVRKLIERARAREYHNTNANATQNRKFLKFSQTLHKLKFQPKVEPIQLTLVNKFIILLPKANKRTSVRPNTRTHEHPFVSRACACASAKAAPETGCRL